VVLICLLFIGAGKFQKSRLIDISAYDFREGDIVLQHLGTKLGSVISDVTNSQYSHCGMVVEKNGEPHVIEAIGPVRIIHVKDWLRQGHRRRFTQLRPRDLSKTQIANVIAEAKTFMGRPYDILYELDDEKIYCSELVYKAFNQALNIDVGKKERLRDLNWKPHQAFIRQLVRGNVPMDRVMVTPESLMHNKHLKLVYSTFPPRRSEPAHDNTILAGEWQGDYTIDAKKTVTANVRFSRSGDFERGSIRASANSSIKIRNVDVTPFRKRRQFTATLVDQRGVRAKLNAQIRDNGERLIGSWKDNHNNVGLFSLERQSNAKND